MSNKEYIQSAISLCALLKLWNNDYEYKKKGGEIYYAVDTNVIKMYSDYVNNSVYGKIFPDDDGLDDDNARVLVRSLSLYIFEKMCDKNRPLMLIYPHNIELKSIITSIMKGVSIDVSNIMNNIDCIKKIFHKYNNDKQSLVNELENNVFDWMEFLSSDKDGILSEFSMITNLLKSTKVCPLKSFEEEKWIFPDLYDKTNISDYEELKSLKKWWRSKLWEYSSDNCNSSKEKYDHNLRVDAEVLSRLEHINNEIAKDNKRLVLITVDKKIHYATNSKKINEQQTFYDIYIRDPKVFLAAKDFSFYPDSKSCEVYPISDFSECSDIGLKCIIEYADKYAKNKDIARNVIGENKVYDSDINNDEIVASVNEIKKSWNDFIRKLIIRDSFNAEKNKDTIKKYIISDASFDDIKGMIEDKAHEIWRDYLKVSTLVGYCAVKDIDHASPDMRNKNNLMPQRGIPALNLTFYGATTHIDKLFETILHSRVIENKDIFDEFENEEPSGYAAFLVYALAFGAVGRWSIARILSSIAIRIARSESEKRKKRDACDETERYLENSNHDPITGNEAAYLLAWSIRHDTKNKEDLQKAKESMKEARAYQEEAEIAINKMARRMKNPCSTECKKSKIIDLRYDCEEIGIDMTSNMYILFSDNINDESVEYRETLLSLGKCKDKIKDIISKMDITNGNFSSDKRLSIRENLIDLMIKRQSLTYYFLINIILKEKCLIEINEDELSFAEKHISIYNEVLNYKSYNLKSCFNVIILLVSLLMYSKEKNKNHILIQLNEKFEENNLKDSYAMPYDKKLYKMLENVVNRYR